MKFIFVLKLKRKLFVCTHSIGSSVPDLFVLWMGDIIRIKTAILPFFVQEKHSHSDSVFDTFLHHKVLELYYE